MPPLVHFGILLPAICQVQVYILRLREVLHTSSSRMRVPASPLLVFGIASAASFGWSAPASPAIGGFHQPGMHNSSAIGSDSPAPGQSATFDSPAPPPMNRFDPGLQSFRSSFNEPADSGTNAGQVSSQGPGAESEDWVADYDESHRPLSTGKVSR